jgi:tetratricopeptide (TPR) repeat protein
LRKVLDTRERLLGAGSPELAPVLAELGGLERRRGNFQAALPLLERVVAIEQANYGTKDVRLALSLNNLALLQGDLGNWRGAEPLLARAVAIEEEGLGRDSPELIDTLENRASVLERLDRHDEAAAARQRAASIRVASAAGAAP